MTSDNMDITRRAFMKKAAAASMGFLLFPDFMIEDDHDVIREAMDNVYKINSNIQVKLYSGISTNLSFSGSAVVYGDRMITANHVIDAYEKILGWMPDVIETTEAAVFLDDGEPLKIIYQDKKNDLAVLSLPREHSGDIRVYQSDPCVGDFVAMVGTPANEREKLSIGEVVSIGTCQEVMDFYGPDDDYFFMVDNFAAKGMSGGGAFIFTKDGLYLAGINKFIYSSMAGIHVINDVEERLDGYI